MTAITWGSVLEQAQQLSPGEQARLVAALRPTARPSNGHAAPAESDKDLTEQQATWAFLQQALDEDRLSARRLFPQATNQR